MSDESANILRSDLMQKLYHIQTETLALHNLARRACKPALVVFADSLGKQVSNEIDLISGKDAE